MKIIDLLKSSFRSIFSHKLRSFLATLGIIIGIMSVITIVSLAEGLKVAMEEQMESFGSNSLSVQFNNYHGTAFRVAYEDAIALAQYSNSITDIAPVINLYETLRTPGQRMDGTQIYATTADYMKVQNLEVAHGRFLTGSDQRERAHVIVIGPAIANDLFSRTDCVGEKLYIGGVPYTVVGVLTSQGSTLGSYLDTIAYIPLSTGQKLWNRTSIEQFLIKAESVNTALQAEADIRGYLNYRIAPYVGPNKTLVDESRPGGGGIIYNIRPARDKDGGPAVPEVSLSNFYYVYNQSQMIEQVKQQLTLFTLIIGGIAAISLLVGGIGIMNIMLVSVVERTREIGLRKAVGARNSDVLFQFLLEAVVLTAFGGMLGLVGGIGASFLIASFINEIRPVINFIVVLTAAGFSAGIGIISGMYPAFRAARLNPIEALHRE
jgi:putative ABC transport system permease protein